MPGRLKLPIQPVPGNHFSGVKKKGVGLESKLRISGAIPPFFYMPP